MIEVPHTPQPEDAPRRMMEPAVCTRILEDLESDRPIADDQQLNAIAREFLKPVRLEPWEIARQFGDSLGDNYGLLWDDLGLMRPCLGNEHITAVFDGVELDYAPLFYDEPAALQIARMTPQVQDSGKVLSVAKTGDNFSQAEYNDLVTRNIMRSVSDELMPPYAKKAVELLVEYGDVVGGILQNHDVEESITAFQDAWPEELRAFRDDLMLIAYLSDASAHSGYRLYHNVRYATLEPAVREHDAKLDFLFANHLNGGVTLTPDRCTTILERFPAINRTRHLLTGEPSPFARDADVFGEVVRRKVDAITNGEDLWFYTEPFAGRQPILRIKTTGRVSLTTKFSNRPEYQTYSEYHRPGDGRVWCHFIEYNAHFPMMGSLMLHHPLSESQTAHTDPVVAQMKQRYWGGRNIQAENIGHPLSERRAWEMINEIENTCG